MELKNLKSWDLRKDADGLLYCPVHRHDNSLLKIPMIKGQLPAPGAVHKFYCVDGQYMGYAGFADEQWAPQMAPKPEAPKPAPKAEEKKPEAPKAEEKKPEAPKAVAPKVEASAKPQA